VEKAAITAIIFGAMLFVRGLIPGLLGWLMQRLRNFCDHPSPSTGPTQNIKTDMRRYGNIRLVVGGGAMMILGLLWRSF
jgi:hypothetical protein